MTAPIPLSAVTDANSYGGKAAQLGAAIQAGLPVPEGFALDPSFVDAIVNSEAAALAALGDVIEKMSGPLAVRSSAIGEDGPDTSFAGQHATVLNVNGTSAVITAIKTVWQSGRSEAALAYRKRVGANMDVRVGVVIQALIVADVAGVLFSCNPVTGADELVIEASWGLGEAIVQGLVIPDRYRIGKTGDILEQSIGIKDIAVRIDPDDTTLEEAVAPGLIHSACLNPSDLQALRELVVKCDETFGTGPHDIEWAIAGQTVYLLQRRPVST